MYTGSYAVIENLLRHGADIRVVDAHGNTPIHIACEEDSNDMLKLLFSHAMVQKDKLKQILSIRNNQGISICTVYYWIVRRKKAIP